MWSLTPKHLEAIGFNEESGFMHDELEVLNSELSKMLSAIEPYSDSWFVTAKNFHDHVSRYKSSFKRRILAKSKKLKKESMEARI